MAEVTLIKLRGGVLAPAFDADSETLEKIKNGSTITAQFKQPRNPDFHRKFFALLNFAFDYWDPDASYPNGEAPAKNFDRFRKDILILAGHRTLVVNIRNEVRYEAGSISFGKMDEIEFNNVYRSVFNVLWAYVLSKVEGMTERQAEEAANRLLEFN